MPTSSAERAAVYERHRRELIAYATRLVVRPAVAEELVQEAALRLLGEDRVPVDENQLRAWLFRVVSNLAIDHLRRHSTWREQMPVDLRARAEADPAFMAASGAMRGAPEMAAIAREHLAVCFGCTLRNLPPREAAALLLKEVHGFTTREAADALDASPVQVKNWLQSARRTLDERYGATCALVAKQGVCHQCVELDVYFNGARRDPLAGTARDLRARIAIVREQADATPGPWHRRLLALVDEVLPAE